MKVRLPYILLLLATCIWGGNFVAGKGLVAHMPPITLAAFRWGIAFVILAPFVGKEAWRHRRELLVSWKMVLFLALTGVAGFNSLTYVAVQYTGSINASLMNSATPIFIVLITWFVMKDQFAWGALPGILISMLGVGWMITQGRLMDLVHLRINRGDLYMLAAVLCWALYSVGMKKMSGRFPASAFLLVQIAIAMLVLIPLSIVELQVRDAVIGWSWPLAAGLVYVGVFASLVAFMSWNRAIELIGPQRCAGFLNFIPLFSALFAISFTGESLHVYHFVGAALIVAGVYVTNVAMRRRQTNAAGKLGLR
ncbi:DMT family transporter [Paenibacillus whitsoniae]|nr:DMT family transporter [Paenibacillus whitsoniae]